MSAKNYNLKEAYNKALTGKARLHYLENYEHDSRRGHAGEYSGNHPKYSRGVAMAGDPMSPMKELDADLEFMPVEDIAGQGTEGVNMKTNPINNTDPNKKTKIQPFQDPGAPEGFVPTFGQDVEITGRTGVLQGRQTFSGPQGREGSPNVTIGRGKTRRPAEYKEGQTTTHESVRKDGNDIVPTTTKYTFNKTKKSPTPGTVYRDFEQKNKYDTDTPYRSEQLTFKKYAPSMMKSPMKEQKYGGNKGDESRSRRDFAGPSMMKSPMNLKLNTKFTSMRERVKKDRR